MKIGDIRAIAKSRGIPTGKQTKAELIKSIQLGEGNFDCFSSAASGECDQVGCSWRDECFDAAQKGKPS